MAMKDLLLFTRAKGNGIPLLIQVMSFAKFPLTPGP